MYNLRPLARHCNGAFDREVGRLLQRTLYFWLYLSRAPNAQQTRSDGGNPILGMTLFCTIECSSKNDGEAVRPRGGSRVRPLRSVTLLFVRKGMLWTGARRMLPRLSRDSFMPERFCTN